MDSAIAKQANAEAVFEENTLSELIERVLVRYLPKETIIKKYNTIDLAITLGRTHI